MSFLPGVIPPMRAAAAVKEVSKVVMASCKSLTLLSAFLLLSACAGLPVRGTVGGQAIETRVDTEVARYYLANYLGGKRSDASLDERIDRVYQGANGNLPDRADLKR